ncbi:phage Gp37/Gp68 family protein [Burkholderia pseudomallei MSHR4375]|uniref:phage Gp37/Gp68 family protein n=1 Tax=Burkholderia pseudomallei TaxID=28450 RepID=UPI0005376CEF|nr:phage Gp37/Gp68 family protein [Burkholderia pseudomallei]KGV79278.1 phage Gp37/Gp68 family protein [Burkholderia pseudomallei MSHR4375]
MSENSKIEWTDHTFNAWIGCTKISPGCDHCYAERERASTALRVVWGAGNPRHRTAASTWNNPKRWNARHGEFFAKHDRRQRVFCASLSDVFDNAVPPAWRMDLFRLIGDTPNLDWLLLTKRIGNVPTTLREIGVDRLPDNVWLGATIVNQEEADRDIPKLLAVPARVRFLSMEPLLGPVDISRHLDYCEKLDKHGISRRAGGQHIKCDKHCGISWVIAGGESGPGARPMHPEWARDLRDQCAAAGVAFHFKQHGEWAPGSGDFGSGSVETAAIALDGRVAAGGYRVEDYPRGAASGDGWSMVHRIGKRAAGRLLDGRTHDEFPRAPR